MNERTRKFLHNRNLIASRMALYAIVFTLMSSLCGNVLAHGDHDHDDDCCGEANCTKKYSEQCENCRKYKDSTAREKFLAGLNEIRNDDWTKALALYKEAGGIECKFKKVYARQAGILAQACDNRKLLEKKSLTEEEIKSVKSAWTYCIIRKAYKPAIAIAQGLNKIAPSASSAELLAGTYMRAEDDKKAWEVISKIDEKEMAVSGKLTYTIIAARMGKIDDAKKMLAAAEKDEIPAMYRLRYAAALALCSQSEKAISEIKAVLGKTCGLNSKRIASLIRTNNDFNSLHEMPEYKAIFENNKKATSTPCSSCPLRGKCSRK